MPPSSSAVSVTSSTRNPSSPSNASARPIPSLTSGVSSSSQPSNSRNDDGTPGPRGGPPLPHTPHLNAKSLFGASFGMGASAWVRAEPTDDDAVERCVRGPIAAGVEAMPADAPGRCGDRCGTAEVREPVITAEPFGVVTGGDEELAGDAGADTVERDQVRRDRSDERLEDRVELAEFFGELLVAARDGSQRGLGRFVRGAALVGRNRAARSISCRSVSWRSSSRSRSSAVATRHCSCWAV